MKTFVVLLIPYPIVGKGTSYASSMIIVVKHGCICCLRSQKPWNVSKTSVKSIPCC